ncbi:hypothetical protein I0P70_20235 [Pontibacter sp. FD36]|uniref:hypothetical protein n=1 Tax=Pontibacter sp. FD36 TaxID=2789860 RepID=UPI0018AADCD5|nr:hypothetical protein [Pontibacter sp. FD36]MBF8965591.1 hypothetical protein [Pontibacter sp. FD36]
MAIIEKGLYWLWYCYRIVTEDNAKHDNIEINTKRFQIMIIVVIFMVLLFSFSVTSLAIIFALGVTKFVAKAYGYEVNLITLAKRSFWLSWGINTCIYYYLFMNEIGFNGVNALLSIWTMVLCGVVVAFIVYLNYHVLKKPYNENKQDDVKE